MATEVLEQGLKNRDRTTKAACIKALSIIKGEAPKKGRTGRNRRTAKPRIQEIKSNPSTPLRKSLLSPREQKSPADQNAKSPGS